MGTVVYHPYLYPMPEWIRVAAPCWGKICAVGHRLGLLAGLLEYKSADGTRRHDRAVPQTAVIPVVTRRYGSGLLNFAAFARR
jgi:hypothetical protein